MPLLAEEILKHGKIKLSKVFILKKFDEFKATYPLVCVPKVIKEEYQRALALSRFPSEVMKDVFVGNLTNILNKDYAQLKMLNIKNIVSITPSKPEIQEFNVVHFEAQHFNKDLESLLDLGEIIEEIKDLEGETLILCING